MARLNVVFWSMVATVAVVTAAPVFGQVADDLEVISIEDLQRGSWATVQGEVTRFRDRDEFILTDGTGRVEVYIRGGLRRPGFSVGDTVTVSGWVDDDRLRRPLELYADTIVTPDGTTLEISPPNDDWD